MSRALKRLAAMKRNPRDRWTIRDASALCGDFGLDCQPPSQGSHLIVSHPKVEGLLTIPARRPIKPFYVMLLVQLVESVLELE